MSKPTAHFYVGQVVHHLKFDYRGVIVDVDPEFQGSDEWYEKVAKSQPPKDEPWYRVLVNDAEHVTYVAERNMEADDSGLPVTHPLVDNFFSEFRDGSYIIRQTIN